MSETREMPDLRLDTDSLENKSMMIRLKNDDEIRNITAFDDCKLNRCSINDITSTLNEKMDKSKFIKITCSKGETHCTYIINPSEISSILIS